MSKIQGSKSFAQKFNLEGTGSLVRVSQETRDAAISLYRRSDELVEKGKEYS